MRREFQDSLNLLPRHAEFFHQLVNAHILKVLEYRGYRHPAAFKHPCAGALAGAALHGGALGPIESCQVLTVLSSPLKAHRTPKLVFRQLLRRQTIRKQSVQFFLCRGKTWHGALFDGGQGCIQDFLNRLVGTPAHDGVNPPLLLQGEMNGHAAPPLVLSTSGTFRVRENPLRGNGGEQPKN